jgi:hypothetical protein
MNQIHHQEYHRLIYTNIKLPLLTTRQSTNCRKSGYKPLTAGEAKDEHEKALYEGKIYRRNDSWQ